MRNGLYLQATVLILVMEAGPPALLAILISLIEHGNTVYIKNEAGQPILRLDLDPLSESDAQRIRGHLSVFPFEILSVQ